MPLGFLSRWLLVLTIALGVPAGRCCAAQERSADGDFPLTVSAAKVGFDGAYKAGRWAAVTVELDGRERCRGELEIIGRDSDGVRVRYFDPAGRFDHAGGKSTVRLLFQAGSIGSRIELRVKLDDGRERILPLAVPGPLASTMELVVTAGPSLGAEDLPRLVKRNAEFAYRNQTVKAAADLPANRWGYDGVDWVLLPLGRDGFAAELTAEQVAALQDWVRGGGRLMLTAAATAQANFGANGPWRELSPGEVGAAARLRSANGIESAGGAALDFDTNDLSVPAFVADVKQPRGRLEILEGGVANDRPLAVRTPHGFGQVIFIALDLEHSPWTEWSGRGQLLRSLLQGGRSEIEEEKQGAVRGQVTHLGYEDLTGQLRAALEQYPGVSSLSFTAVAVIAVIYLLLIGPADYFLYHGLKLPRAGTWFTVTLLAVACGALGIWLTQRTHGDQIRVNQVEIVDFDLASGRTRGAAWVHLYSPTARRYDLGWKPPQAERNAAAYLSWQGLAGRGLGGLNARVRATTSSAPYTVSVPGAEAAVHEAPLMVAGSKAFTAAWDGEEKLPPQAIVASPFGLLIGEVQNPLPFELTECRVLYGEHMYRLPRPLAPGAKAGLQELTPLDLESRLTARKIVEQKDVTTPWDPALTEVPRIVDMLMFHEAAKGANYTGMVHRFQPQIDLSAQLRVGRAVLVGRGPVQGELTGDALPAAEEQRRESWIRLIVPVNTRPQEGTP